MNIPETVGTYHLGQTGFLLSSLEMESMLPASLGECFSPHSYNSYPFLSPPHRKQSHPNVFHVYRVCVCIYFYLHKYYLCINNILLCYFFAFEIYPCAHQIHSFYLLPNIPSCLLYSKYLLF